MEMRRIKYLAGLAYASVLLTTAGCSTMTTTFTPQRTATILDGQPEQFGICVTADRSGSRSFMWQQFLANRGGTRFDSPVELTGYEIAITRGESCHRRVVNLYQTAMYFDLSSLASRTVVSARLRLRDQRWGGVDAPYSLGTPDECRVLYVGEATDAWAGGVFPGPAGSGVTGRPFIPWRAARRENGPFNRLPAEIDVTATVGSWLRGDRRNQGFVITPDQAAVTAVKLRYNHGGVICPLFIDRFELEVTVTEP